MVSALRGLFTALVTPFKHDGSIDESAFQNIVEWQINKGVHGLVPCGTTGESPTLTFAEHARLIKLCVEAANGKIPVLAGAGANCTQAAIELSKAAKNAGADAILSVTPYYNRPSPEGLYQHFKAIHDAVDIPIVLYNIPGRAAIDMSNETIAKLAELPNIIGIKDASGNLARVTPLSAHVGSEFIQLSGEDITAVGFNAMGGHGCISVTSNVAPGRCAQIQENCMNGNYRKAQQLQVTLVALHHAMFAAPSPAPAKYALSLMNKCQPYVRLPLLMPNDKIKRIIRDALLGAGVI